ncbi:MAG: ATP-binding cassette domain-containing protein [candidate division Zixibacteria bacterium]|nr:ATP-binding cassette domain-containing protein [candidate division Zixibacteria bacterium]
MSEKIIVELNNIFKQSDRGFQLFKDLNFSLKAGETAVIIGGAGSGKSSLIELIIGERFPDEGSIEVFGVQVKKHRKGRLKKIRRKIGGVGGLFSLVPSFTVSENITFPLVLNAEKKAIKKERLFKMLTEFSLLKQAKEYPRKLTRVESSLVQYARASIANQPLLIIDEPLAGLDKHTYKRIFDYLVKVSLSGRSMIVLCSEMPEETIPNTKFYRLENGTLV